MIPHPIAPLTGLSVLVTRPSDQADALCECVRRAGGEPIRFPTIAIEPIATDERTRELSAPDWLIFTSTNAVQHGLSRAPRGPQTRIAAIGAATQAALAQVDLASDAVPPNRASSESLLDHPAFATIGGQSVMIVKGVGGRDLLQQALTDRGARVATLEVYRRARPHIDAQDIQSLQQRWRDQGIGIVTLTSVETMNNLLELLDPAGRALLHDVPIAAASERILQAARERGLTGAGILAAGADDASIVGAIAAWHARAR